MVFPRIQCFVGKNLVFKFTKINVYKMIATTLAYFLVWASSCSTAQSNNLRSTFDKAVMKNNDFDGSVSVRNGRVFVNWSTIGPWNLSKQVNMTVYFLSNYSDQYGNISYGVTITTCVAKKNNGSWKINSMKGNLLEFCNKSGLCGPFDDDVVVLIDSNWIPKYKNLSCQLFTTCSNFISTFGIQIIVDANNRQYSYHSGDLSIPSQNIPPSPTNINLLQNAIGISWDYPNLSQLCGFGSKGSTDIKFLIRQYKSNHCIFIEEKTLDFDDDAHIAKFSNISTTSNYKYIFYLTAMSLTSNQTSRPWLKQIETGSSQDTKEPYKVHGGILSVSWQPEWNCLEKDVVEQILVCITSRSLCVPVCQVTLFSNGSISPVASFSRNLINICNDHSDYCSLNSNNTDMVDGRWNSSSRTISCNIFKQCTGIQNVVLIKKNRIDAETNKTIPPVDAPRSIFLMRINQPSAPTNLHILSVHQTNVTIAWDFEQCKTFQYTIEFFVCVLSSVEHHPCEKMENPWVKGHPMDYMYTVKGLSYFTNYSIQIYAENKYEKEYKSPHTSHLKVQTKKGAPLKGPTITRIIPEKDGIKLSWELPSKNSVLRGIPKIFIIEVLDAKNQTVLNKTLNGTNITSAVIKDLEKCDFFRIKMCNSPTLCSQFSNLMQYEKPCGLKDPEKPKGLTQNPMFFVIILLSFLLVAAISITCWARRRMRTPRPRLPIPVPPDNCDTDYMQTSQVNEYDTLDQECLLLN